MCLCACTPGDIVPRNPLEWVVDCVVVALGVLMFGLALGSLAELVANSSKEARQAQVGGPGLLCCAVLGWAGLCCAVLCCAAIVPRQLPRCSAHQLLTLPAKPPPAGRGAPFGSSACALPAKSRSLPSPPCPVLPAFPTACLAVPCTAGVPRENGGGQRLAARL